jgi:hypothetical protein
VVAWLQVERESPRTLSRAATITDAEAAPHPGTGRHRGTAGIARLARKPKAGLLTMGIAFELQVAIAGR